MKKKIIIVSNTVGVIYKFKFELLEELLKKDYEVYLIAQNENEDIFLKKIIEIGVNYLETKISRRGINPLKDAKLFISYLLTVRKIKPDFIYTFTIKPNLYGGLISRILKIDCAATITGLGTSLQKKTMFSYLLHLLYKQSLKYSKCVFFENKQNLNYFLNNKLIKKDKAVLVPGSGVNTEKFYPMEKIRKNKELVFLFMGRIMKEKGIEEYLGAAKEIKKEFLNVEFWILGDFEEKRYISIIKKLEKEKIVKYLGVSNDVRQIIRDIDFLIQPSYHEGMSNVILETSAMGKVVLASNISGCREAIVSSKNLFLPQNVQSLVDIIKLYCFNKIDYKKESDRQRIHVKNNFSRKKVIKENLNKLESENKQ